MWSRGKDKQYEGRFAYTLYPQDGSEAVTVGGFKTAQEADRAAEVAARLDLFGTPSSTPSTSVDELFAMSDEELLAELGA